MIWGAGKKKGGAKLVDENSPIGVKGFRN